MAVLGREEAGLMNDPRTPEGENLMRIAYILIAVVLIACLAAPASYAGGQVGYLIFQASERARKQNEQEKARFENIERNAKGDVGTPKDGKKTDVNDASQRSGQN
jgi:hypothetical protein